MKKNRISFNEKGAMSTIEDESGNVIEEIDFPIPGWEEMTLEDKALATAELQESIVQAAKENEVPIEPKSMSRQERRRMEREFPEEGMAFEVILSQMLRNRQLEKAEEMVPKMNELANPITLSEFKKTVKGISNQEIISSYLVCPDCGSEFLSYHDAIEAARHSRSVDEWFSRMEHLRSAHLDAGMN